MNIEEENEINEEGAAIREEVEDEPMYTFYDDNKKTIQGKDMTT